MGNLKPGATYIYEHEQGIVYARESGSTTRIEVGRNFDLHDHIMEDKLWGDIRRMAKTNSALHEAIERVKILYHLSKDNGK
jgi:hypothetical protein